MRSQSSSDAVRSPRARGPWWWVPSLYFAQGLPFVIVMTVSVILYKRLGISNTEIALYTSLLYLPWLVKPLWSPVVDALRTKRWWIIVTQLLVGAGLAGVALSLPLTNFLRWTLAFFWMLAFSSATHDIAADGFYMLALPSHEQAWFVGIRSTCYRIAMIAGQGVLVMIAGSLETRTGLPEVSIEARAQVANRAPTTFDPTAWKPLRGEGPLRILSQQDTLTLSLSPRTQQDVTTLVQRVRAWNIQHGFYREEAPIAEQSSSGKAAWVLWLEEFIRRYFAPPKRAAAAQDVVGDVAVGLLAVSGPVAADKPIHIVFERATGDSSFQVIEGSRFTVTEANWRQPFAVVLQVDHRLDQPSSAVFRARSGNFALAWASTFYLASGIFLALGLYHALVLPRPKTDCHKSAGIRELLLDFVTAFLTFFLKKHILLAIAFLLLYRFAEAQLVKLASPFLLDLRETGGLALSTGEVGFVYGTVGIVLLVLGGILGGWVAARHGLKLWIIWMALAINLPNLAYVFLSYARPESFFVVNVAVAIEQFGYGFGFAGYMLYMLYIARRDYELSRFAPAVLRWLDRPHDIDFETSHYAICTAFMAAGMMLPGMVSGWLQELIGYQRFFVWVMLATIPSFLVTALVYFHIDPRFGRQEVTR